MGTYSFCSVYFFLYTPYNEAEGSILESPWLSVTRHNSADSVSTSNFVCIKEVAIRTTFSYMINIAGIIYTLLTFNVPVMEMHSTYVFDKLCFKTTLLRSFLNKFKRGYVMRSTSGYASI